MKSYPLEVKRLAWVFRLFLDNYARGLESLLGVFPFPDEAETTMMLEWCYDVPRQRITLANALHRFGYTVDVPVSGSLVDAARAVLDIVESVGGVEVISTEFRRAKNESSEGYQVMVDFYRLVGRGRPCGSEKPAIPILEKKYGMSDSGLRRRREAFILETACRIVTGSASPETRGRKRKSPAVCIQGSDKNAEP